MKMKHYFESQNDRWHEHYLASEKMVNELEQAIVRIEAIALQHITDNTAKDAIKKIVNEVWGGSRT